MAIKPGMKLVEIIGELIRGYKKFTGKEPAGLDLIKIKQEAVKRFEDMNKVVDMQGRTLDPSKTIMGGTQEGAAFKSGIMKTTGTGPKKVVTKGLPDKEFQDLRRSFRMNIAKNSPDFNQDLADRIIKRELYQDLSDTQRKDFLDNLDFVLKNPRDGNADGGRIGLKSGSFLVKGAKELGKKYKGSTLEAILENPKLLGTELSYEGLMEILRMSGMMQKGGRVGFKKGMDRRTFMKIMGGLTALPILGKFFKGAKTAAPAVEKVTEVARETPSYFFDLVAKIKLLGRQSKIGPQERVNEYSYVGKNGDEYTLTEDIVTGDARIVKDKMGGVRVGEDEVAEGIANRSVMEYKSGKSMADEGTGGTLADEYDEYEVRFDYDGTEAEADNMSEFIRKEITKEVSSKTPSIKKASGGIARMLGE